MTETILESGRALALSRGSRRCFCAALLLVVAARATPRATTQLSAQRPAYQALVTAPVDAIDHESAGPSESIAEIAICPPPNLVADDAHRTLIRTMWQRSDTFRRQCARIAGTREVQIAVHLGMPWDAGGARAITRITRSGVGIRAEIYLPQFDDAIELLAHELEHVIEQLDGVNLREKTRRAGRTASVIHQDGVYETHRAVHTGRTVAQEVKDRAK
jgi:hypothetical protein